jgi:uncharacterized damage-inducible protein DinB
MTTIVRDLFLHMEWADATVWSAIAATPAAVTDARLREILAHLHVAQRGFLRAWRGEPRDAPYPPLASLPEIAAWARSAYGEALAFLDALSDADAARSMPLPWASMVEQRLGCPPARTTLHDTLLQVPLHSLYHRGQVNARLREIGGTPPTVDYIAWVWLGRPAAAWPSMPFGPSS